MSKTLHPITNTDHSRIVVRCTWIKTDKTVCNAEHTFILPTADIQRWQDGEVIQNVFPLMLPEHRDILINGMCADHQPLEGDQ